MIRYKIRFSQGAVWLVHEPCEMAFPVREHDTMSKLMDWIIAHRCP
jgi:hypothetical protein